MGIFQQFPYSNFHEFNLDQIIKIMREMQDEWLTTKTEWNSYKEFIDNYFENLDVSQEVLEAIRIMAINGELDPIINPAIISEVTDWLNTHITPTTPAIDASLSIAGAGADAKVTGDKFKILDTEVTPMLITYPLSNLNFRMGNLSSNGSISDSDTRIVTNLFSYAKKGTYFKIASGYDFRIGLYSAVNYSDGVATGFTVDEVGVFDSSVREYTFTKDTYFRIALRFQDTMAEITPADGAAAFVKSYYIADNTPQVQDYDLLEKAIISYAEYLKSDGSVGFTANMCRSDYIPVDPRNIYAFSAEYHEPTELTTNYSRLCAYDKDKNFITTIQRMNFSTADSPTTGTYGFTFIPPARAAYIRFSWGYSGVDVTLKCAIPADLNARQSAINLEAGVNDLDTTKFSIKRNDKYFVSQMVDIAESYRDSGVLRYGTNTPLAPNYDNGKHIDCSTFMGMVLRGISYEDGPYVIDYPPEELNPYDSAQWVANPDYEWSINPANYDYELIVDVDNPTTAEARRASQLGQMFDTHGREIPKDRHLANLEVGDLLFWARKNAAGEWIQPGRYKHITHVALVIEKTDAPENASWDTDLYPFSHKYIDARYNNGGEPISDHILEETPTGTTVNSIESLVMIARPDCGAIKSEVFGDKKLIFNDNGTVSWVSI